MQMYTSVIKLSISSSEHHNAWYAGYREFAKHAADNTK